MIEREVKLLFASAGEARAALTAAGARPLRPRRLQEDVLFDTPDQALRSRGCALRVRAEYRPAEAGPHASPAEPGDRGTAAEPGHHDTSADGERRGAPERVVLTFKGPVQPGPMKTREEHETAVADRETLVRVLEALALRPWFRYQKFREELAAEEATIAIDETPVGTFVEIEGSEAAILAITAALGRSPADFIASSYYRLFMARREAFGLAGDDMVFAAG